MSTRSPEGHREGDARHQNEGSRDLLAAVLLHVLISAHPERLTVDQAAAACERSPTEQRERELVEQPLREMVDDGLACHREERFGATRAALRAHELSI